MSSLLRTDWVAMDEPISVVTWNINGEVGISDERMEAQLEFLDEKVAETDILMFQAVSYGSEDGEQWGGQLAELLQHFGARGYHCAHTADWAQELYESDVQPHQAIEAPHNRCNLTVSRWPIERTPLSLRQFDRPKKLTYYTTHFPEKLLVSTVTADSNEIDVWNVGIINGSSWHEEKVKMLETVYSRIYTRVTEVDRDVLLGGDFNAPKREGSDGAVVPHGQSAPKYRHYPQYGTPYYYGDSVAEAEEFTYRARRQRAESDVFDPDVAEWRMRDAYWTATESTKQASEEDYTHEVAGGSRKRLDHVLVSERFTVRRCEILNDEMVRETGPDVSDHAPVVAEVQLSVP